MKKIGLRMIPLGAALAALPAMSNAAAPDLALNACAQQVVSGLAARQGSTPKYSVRFDHPAGFTHGPLAESSVYRFTLEAHDPKSGTLVARAECDAQYDGRVIVYRPLPLISE
jgi:hypothetical protein